MHGCNLSLHKHKKNYKKNANANRGELKPHMKLTLLHSNGNNIGCTGFFHCIDGNVLNRFFSELISNEFWCKHFHWFTSFNSSAFEGNFQFDKQEVAPHIVFMKR